MTTSENESQSGQPLPAFPTLCVYLNFEGTCQEAFEAYRAIFGGEFSDRQTFADMPPSDDMPPMPDEWMGKVMHVSLPIGDSILMGSDIPPGFGPPLVVGTNYSVSYTPPSRAEADRVFAALSQGGQVSMEMQDMFWGDYFGACTDRFGINWQVHHQNASAES